MSTATMWVKYIDGFTRVPAEVGQCVDDLRKVVKGALAPAQDHVCVTDIIQHNTTSHASKACDRVSLPGVTKQMVSADFVFGRTREKELESPG